VALTLEKNVADTVQDSTIVSFVAGREHDMIEDHSSTYHYWTGVGFRMP
jgi:hypothetical protein